jgi:hypothetical protein
VIHPHFFESLAFYPDGYPARHGRYVAGVVSAKTRAPAEDRTHLEAEMRLYDAGGLVSLPWPDHSGAVAAAFRYSYTGALLSVLQSCAPADSAGSVASARRLQPGGGRYLLPSW